MKVEPQGRFVKRREAPGATDRGVRNRVCYSPWLSKTPIGPGQRGWRIRRHFVFLKLLSFMRIGLKEGRSSETIQPPIGGKLLKTLFVALLSALFFPGLCECQSEGYFSRLNTYSAFTEHSNTSSYIHWGVSRKRRLAAVGGSYARRFNAPHWFDWTPHASVFYELEAVPAIFIQDQVATDIYETPDGPITVSESIDSICVPGPYSSQGVNFVRACGTRWDYIGGVSPLGFRVNFGPKHRLQPFIDSHLGFYFSPRDEPVSNSSALNFTFEFGAGFELYRGERSSMALEYRLHHFSNAYLSANNPGADNQIIKFTYSFGGKLQR
jgi:hypothetical protein